MTRDKELLLAILVQAHAVAAGGMLEKINFAPAPSYPELVEHARLLQDAGLIEINLISDYRVLGGIGVKILRLTSAGHDFVENAANDEAWKAATKSAGNYGLKVFTGILEKVLAEIVLRTLRP